MKIQGYYLNGKTSEKASAFLEVSQENYDNVTISIDKDNSSFETLFVNWSEINVSSRLAQTPREISFGDNELFITEENDAIDQIIKQSHGSSQGTLLHSLESNIKLVLLATGLTGLLIWSFIIYGIPSLSKTIAFQLPQTVTSSFGSTLNVLDETVFEPSEIEEETQLRITELVAPYIIEHRELNPSINFRKGMKANAIALPNGQIVFTDEFIELAENDEQLLAVFFHELGHLKNKHLARRILQDSFITLLVIFVTGDVDTVDFVTGLPTLILDLAYSRDFETEADTYALDLLHENNIPLESFSNIMQNLNDYYDKDEKTDSGIEHDHHTEDKSDNFGVPDFLSTHPSTVDRIQFVKDYKKKHKVL
jgi:Zn-dependent protease with chaperone function